MKPNLNEKPRCPNKPCSRRPAASVTNYPRRPRRRDARGRGNAVRVVTGVCCAVCASCRRRRLWRRQEQRWWAVGGAGRGLEYVCSFVESALSARQSHAACVLSVLPRPGDLCGFSPRDNASLSYKHDQYRVHHRWCCRRGRPLTGNIEMSSPSHETSETIAFLLFQHAG